MQSVSVQKNTTKYYQEAKVIFSPALGTRATGPIVPVIPPISPTIFSRFSPFYEYGEKFENIWAMSEAEVEEINQNVKFQEMCQIVEADIENAYSCIYDYMSVEDIAACEEAITYYIKSGCHNVDFLDELTWEMENENAVQLTCYAGALLDQYIELNTILNISNREIASDKQQELSCEEILKVKLAILSVEVAWSYGTCIMLPGANVVGVTLTSVYAMATMVLYQMEYNDCVKRRNNDKKP
ncbi:MAG: hypothetical protein K2M83_10840 [Muribaculaceae bacterium]|nr:hypothetical protein [Muribaculaceae bacterium]